MKSIIFKKYGSPDVLELVDIEKPVPKDNEVVVRVHASSVNAQEWHFVTGKPYLVRIAAGLRAPKDTSLGADLAGVIDSVGSQVTEFKPGDEVFGVRWGAFAEYVRSTGKGLVPKPTKVTYEQAAAVPVAAITALQGLRDKDKGDLQLGQKVLVNGAGGGVGHFAVQIAKALGAEVTGVTKTASVELVRSLGADHVIDYTKEDFTKSEKRYDLIFDLGGTHSLGNLRRVLTPKGTFVQVGAVSVGNFLGPLTSMIKPKLISRFVSQKLVSFLAQINKDDLRFLGELLETGKIKPVIDKTYPLSQTADAVRYVIDGHARGKVVIKINS